MKKTLYVTDLDGTLLDRKGMLSDFTREAIGRIVRAGGLFSISTARSCQSAKAITDQLCLDIPAVLSSGAAVYHLGREEYMELHPLPRDVMPAAVELFQRLEICGFLYVMENGRFKIYHGELKSPADRAYYDRRVRIYGDCLYQSPDLVELARREEALYLVLYGERERLDLAFRELSAMPALGCTFYEDVYNGSYFIDVFNGKVSKGTGVLRLKELIGADELVAFGDNLNDIPMFEVADRSYATQNGVPQAKEAATGVIPSCDEDSVARFILEEMGLEYHWGGANA